MKIIKYSNQSKYYKDVTIHACPPGDIKVSILRGKILQECDKRIKTWYTDWPKDLWYCVIAETQNNPFSIACARTDGKVMCYLYTLKQYRKNYRDLAQTDYTQIFIDNAITDEIYLSIDAFSKKHERLAKAWDRVITNGGIPDEYTPYKGKWLYDGVQTYRGIDQHFYKLNLKGRQ